MIFITQYISVSVKYIVTRKNPYSTVPNTKVHWLGLIPDYSYTWGKCSTTDSHFICYQVIETSLLIPLKNKTTFKTLFGFLDIWWPQ